jgi:hypothetical protein
MGYRVWGMVISMLAGEDTCKGAIIQKPIHGTFFFKKNFCGIKARLNNWQKSKKKQSFCQAFPDKKTVLHCPFGTQKTPSKYRAEPITMPENSRK